MQDENQIYGSSLSSNSMDSRRRVRGDYFPIHQLSASDGDASYFSSPSDSSQMQKWTPALACSGDNNEYLSSSIKGPPSGPLLPAFIGEGTSGVPYSGGSTSSRSDNSEYEPLSKLRAPSHRYISTRCSFMSKPVHPLSLSCRTPDRESHGAFQTEANQLHRDNHSASAISDTRSFHREGLRWSSASSVDYTDLSEQIEPERPNSAQAPPEVSKCGLCERYLTQRSPWSSRRILRSGDMPITGVLSCRHVFHAECLDQTTPKTHKHDPPCPLCARSEDENLSVLRVVSRIKNEFPRLKAFGEEGTSRSWSCGQAGDCVKGALQSQARNSVMLLNRSRLKKQLSMKGVNSSKDIDKLKKSGASLQLAQSRRSADLSYPKSSSGPVLKRW